MLQINSLLECIELFHDQDSCLSHLESLFWKNSPVCPHCFSEKAYKYKKRKILKCADCKKQFTVTTNTIFEGTRLPLKKWFLAIFLNSAHKKGISSCQLARDIKVTQKTAWFMLQRIREAYSNIEIVPITTVAYLDEAYIGGKSKNKHRNKRTPNTTGRNLKDKIAVWGVMEEGGDVFCTPVPNVKEQTLRPLVYEHVESGATIISDDWQAYGNLGKHYTHYTVNHGAGQYVNADDPSIHTNCIENYWSQVKRSIMGCYHKVSRKHISRYCYEWQYRFNTRHVEDSHRFTLVLQQSAGRHITYKQLIT